MGIKAAIFDVDGLMFDTERLWLDACLFTAKKMKLELEPEFVKAQMGGRADAIRKAFENKFGESFNYDDFYNSFLNEIDISIKNNGLPVKSGLTTLLAYLKKHNYKLGVASSAKGERISQYMEISGINEFDCVICGEMVENSKPAPDIYLLACRKLGLKPCECMVFEDSDNGIMSAHNAGTVAVLVPDIAYNDSKTLNTADYIIKSLDEAICILEGKQ